LVLLLLVQILGVERLVLLLVEHLGLIVPLVLVVLALMLLMLGHLLTVMVHVFLVVVRIHFLGWCVYRREIVSLCW